MRIKKFRLQFVLFQTSDSVDTVLTFQYNTINYTFHQLHEELTKELKQSQFLVPRDSVIPDIKVL